jgi:HlyD family secretion protein
VRAENAAAAITLYGLAVSDTPHHIFRAAALERVASPEQLDHLVSITRPADWILGLVIVVGVACVLAWGIVGRVPTRVAADGILMSSGGRVLDAVSAAAGRLASINAMVGDRVTQGQVVAVIAQTDIEQRHRDTVEVYNERERQHLDLVSRIERELAAKGQNFAKLEAAFAQIIRATEQRLEYLRQEVANLEGLLAKGYMTRRNVEDRRRELNDAQQRKEDAQNEILKLRAQKFDLEAQREQETKESEFRLNEARRQMTQLAGELGRNTQVTSPADGVVIEVKISPGSVLSVGMPVIAIETAGQNLDALLFLPPERGKNVKAGMEVRVEPSTVKREEFGMLVGQIVSVSEFPITPQGMLAMLHNETLAQRFAREGAPYAAMVRLERDDRTPSGYRWAVGSGPSLSLTSGTLTRAEITTRQQRPLELVLPFLKRLTGLTG